jgi:phosphopantetheinyl transferase
VRDDGVVLEFEIDGAVLLVEAPAARDSFPSIARVASRAMVSRPEDVVVRRACARCGASDHGKPLVERTANNVAACSVSFSRTDGYSVAAARTGPSIGVDIESILRVSRHPVDDVLLHPEEQRTVAEFTDDAARHYLASLWVAKEAVVKSTGDGVRIDLTHILIRLDDRTANVHSWPSDLALAAPPRLRMFAVSDDVIGAIAIQH